VKIQNDIATKRKKDQAKGNNLFLILIISTEK